MISYWPSLFSPPHHEPENNEHDYYDDRGDGQRVDVHGGDSPLGISEEQQAYIPHSTQMQAICCGARLLVAGLNNWPPCVRGFMLTRICEGIPIALID